MMIINDLTVVGHYHLVEKAWVTSEGYQGVCVFVETSLVRTGYVGVPEGHVLYGKNPTFRTGVHGEITFANWLFEDRLWYWGFHCGHADTDQRDYEFAKRQGIEYLQHISNIPSDKNATVKDLNFVIEQVKKLSSQMTPAALMRAKIEQQQGD